MTRVSGWAVKLAAGVLGYAAQACGAQAPPPVPVAHSAQLTLEAAASPTSLTLRVRPSAAQPPLQIKGLTVSLDGRALPAQALPDGVWTVPLAGVGASPAARLDVTVEHDGIRELLSGRIALPGAGGPSGGAAHGLLRSHQQLAWWILNIAIVLIGAIAISRRMS